MLYIENIVIQQCVYMYYMYVHVLTLYSMWGLGVHVHVCMCVCELGKGYTALLLCVCVWREWRCIGEGWYMCTMYIYTHSFAPSRILFCGSSWRLKGRGTLTMTTYRAGSAQWEITWLHVMWLDYPFTCSWSLHRDWIEKCKSQCQLTMSLRKGL